jgi:excisionase family DNA binding protein/PAS domain S-box-containing protein
MRELITRLRDPVIAFDRDLTMVAVNLATERLFDYSAIELIGHDTTKLRPVDLRLREERNCQVREQGFIEGVVECLNTAGEVFAVDLRTRRVGLMDTDGIEYLAVMRPVPEERIATAVPRLYTLDETAHLLRKSSRTVRRLLHSGALRGRKVGGTWRIAEPELAHTIGVELSTDREVGRPLQSRPRLPLR